MNVKGIEVLTPETFDYTGEIEYGFPQLRYDEIDVNEIKLAWHRANHYSTWDSGWCPDCDVEDLQTVWVLYLDMTSRGVIIDAPPAPEGVNAALAAARTYIEENQ